MFFKRRDESPSTIPRQRRFETFEQRIVLSAIGLVDCPAVVEQQDELHGFDAQGHEYHALPTPDLSQVQQEPALAGYLDGAAGPALEESLANTFLLNSNLGAAHTIYLDFTGDTTAGTSWNSSFNGGADIVTPEYDFTGEAGFSDAELQRIQSIWQRVAEDFAPFNVNVTTQDPGLAALVKSGGGDTEWGVRVVVGGSGDWYNSGVGGVAYVGSFNWNSDTPVFVFENNLGNGHEKYTAEAISHEVGHALGLSHDGNASTSYYTGHGSGETGWAPIMGVGYYQNLVQWSRGEYPGANNTQDDLAIITGNNGFGYRADDHGNGNGSASLLVPSGDLVSAAGIIETNTDVDVFTFTTGDGAIDLTFSPVARGANLDILAELYDASGTLIATANPTGTLGAQLNVALTAGQYFLHISGTGNGDPTAGGYSDYGSLGQYTIDGTIAGVAGPGSFSIVAMDAQKLEGSAGATAFTFQVSRSGDVSSASSVDWTVQGSQVDATDFAGGVMPSGTLLFAAGESSKTITIHVACDLSRETDEDFTVQLSNASGGTLIATGAAQGTILNDDLPPTSLGISVSPTKRLKTTEAGGTASFTVVLKAPPTADVVIPVTSRDTTEGVVNVSTLTFTPENWNIAQTVTVTGVDDAERDRNQKYTVELGAAQSSDAGYAGTDADDVSVTNKDDDKKAGKGSGKGKNANGALAAGAFQVFVGTDLSPASSLKVVHGAHAAAPGRSEAVGSAAALAPADSAHECAAPLVFAAWDEGWEPADHLPQNLAGGDEWELVDAALAADWDELFSVELVRKTG